MSLLGKNILWSALIPSFCLWAISLPAESMQRGGRGSLISIPMYAGFGATQHSGSNLGGNVNGYTGVAFGFGVDFRPLPKISIGVDMLYITKSFELRQNDTATRFRLAFIELPIKVRYWFYSFFNLYVGPYLPSLLIDASSEALGNHTPSRADFKNDYGFLIGIWLGFPISKKLTLGLDARYVHGFSDIQNDSLPDSNLRTRTLMTSLALTYHF